jgi:nitroimidazol reductase NimA-like FMN-containing flavoprotein (pyridoxamine 5'-phosphate oxidase superfamily)
MTGVLHPDEIEDVLYRHHIGRLACVAGGRPYVAPITYAYADGTIFGCTAAGRKVDALRADPHACFEVDERWDDLTWRSVVAEGTYEELTDPAERRTALRRLRGALPDATAATAERDGIVFRLRLTEKTGRFVRRLTPAVPFDLTRTALADVDLRAGDVANWPHGGGAEA